MQPFFRKRSSPKTVGGLNGRRKNYFPIELEQDFLQFQSPLKGFNRVQTPNRKIQFDKNTAIAFRTQNVRGNIGTLTYLGRAISPNKIELTHVDATGRQIEFVKLDKPIVLKLKPNDSIALLGF